MNGTPSIWHNVISDVPQGSVKGPILFVIYINTLIQEVHNSNLYLFANDNKLFRSILNEDNALLLQSEIDKMYSWSNNSLLQFHPDKCLSMNIRNKNKPKYNYDYAINGKVLDNKSEIKDLGVLIDEHLKFSNHISGKINKANQIMGLIRRTITYLDIHNFNLFYTKV